MSLPSPYGPDRSLPIAAAVLVGSGLLIAAAVYLLTTSAGHFTVQHQTRVAEGQTSQGAWSGPGRPARQSAPLATPGAASGRAQPLPSSPGRVPDWAGSGTSVTPPRSPTRSAHDLRPDRREEVVTGLRPDMSHAELGPPSGGSDPGRSNTGATRAGVKSSPDRGSGAGSVPQVADLGTRSSSASSGREPEWRSEVSELGSQARALSGALAHLDRSGRSNNANPRSDGTNSPTDGDASTAGVNQGSRSTSDSPDPPSSPPQVPVDGGLGWLAAAGAAYAANRLRKRRETDEPTDEA